MVVYFRSFHGSSQIILCDVTVWHLSEWVSLMSMVSIRTSTGLYISRNFNLYGFLVHGWQAIFTFCWSSPWEFTMLKCLILIRNHNLPLPVPYKDLRPISAILIFFIFWGRKYESTYPHADRNLHSITHVTLRGRMNMLNMYVQCTMSYID